VLFLGVLELGLAYLHILNLKAHWTQPLAPVSSRVLPSSASFTSSQAALRQTKSSSSTTHPPARRPLCEVLFTFKSLFSLFSLVFCLAPLAFCGTTVLMLFFPHSDLHALYSSTWAVEVVVLWVSFFAVTHAYLFMGEVRTSPLAHSIKPSVDRFDFPLTPLTCHFPPGSYGWTPPPASGSAASSGRG
jgi:hypothetical protein